MRSTLIRSWSRAIYLQSELILLWVDYSGSPTAEHLSDAHLYAVVLYSYGQLVCIAY